MDLVTAAATIAVVNAVGFAITTATKTHKITDLCGTGAFVLTAVRTIRGGTSYRGVLLNTLVVVWGVRLGFYLFSRVLEMKHDSRLHFLFPERNEAWLDKTRSMFPVKLAGFWFLQALWAWVCMLPIVLASSSSTNVQFGLLDSIACVMAVIGIAIEAVADSQKNLEKAQRPDQWVDTGLWAYSRHPNYFGELLTWWSLYAACFPALDGISMKAFGLLSPVFITWLLNYVSGVPILERAHNQKYGTNRAYIQYRDTTPILVPWKLLSPATWVEMLSPKRN